MIEFQGQRKVVFSRCKFFGTKYARPKHEGKRKIFHETGGSNLLRREEHGNTFAHEIEHFIGEVGSPLKEEEIIRYGQMKKSPLLPDSPNGEYKKAAYFSAAGIRMQFRYRQVRTKATSTQRIGTWCILMIYLCFPVIIVLTKQVNIMDNPFDKIDLRLDDIEKKMSEVVDMLQKKDSPITKTIIDERLVKIDRAAEITGFKKGYLYELVFKNAIPYVRINRSIRFDPEELERWMRSGRPKVLDDVIRSYG